MRELAKGVHQLRGFPPNAVNAYLVEDVVIDAAGKPAKPLLLRDLRGARVSAHALTHAHADHQGCSKVVCETFGVPYWVGEQDVSLAEDPSSVLRTMPDHPMPKLMFKLFAGPGHTVDRALREGDEVAGFQVLDTPGHSPGHVAYWRESDRTLIAGDVVTNMDTLTLIPGLHEPKAYFTKDPELNRRSIARFGELEPSLVLFGHGAPLRDTRKFVAFCERVAR